jgi:hypothetical protein
VFDGGNVGGFDNSADAIYLPAQSEQVKPALYIVTRVAGTNTSLNQVTYGFTIKDPGSTGLTFRLTVEAEGLSGFSFTPVNVAADFETTVVVTQPAAGLSPALLRATGSHTGNAAYPDVAIVSVPALSSGLVGVITTEARITSITATNVYVTASSSAGFIRLNSQTAGTEVIGGGLAAGTWAGGTIAAWVFLRMASTPGTAVFEGGNLGGYGNTRDSLYIPSQLEAIKPPLRVSVSINSTNTSTGVITYAIQVLDPAGSLVTATLAMTSTFLSPAISTTVSNAGTTYFLNVTMPAAGSNAGALIITATNSSYYPDTANLAIPPRGTVPLPTFSETTSETTSSSGTLVLVSYDPYTQISSVQMRVRAGSTSPDTWGAWTTMGGSFVATGRNSYTTSTTMGEKRPGAIEWRAFLTADTSNSFDGGSVRFSPGRTPLPPEIYGTINPDGSFNVRLTGDSDTTGFNYGYAKGASALPSLSFSGSSGGRLLTLTNQGGTSYAALGDVIVVSAAGYNSVGTVGPTAYCVFSSTNQSTTGKRMVLQSASAGVDWSLQDVRFDTGTLGAVWSQNGGGATLVNNSTSNRGAYISISLPAGSIVRRIGFRGSNGGGSTNATLYTNQIQWGGASIVSVSAFGGVGDYTSGTTSYTVPTSSLLTVFMTVGGSGGSMDYIFVEYDAPTLTNSL